MEMFFIFPDSAFSECSDFTLNSDSNEGLNKQVPDVEYGFLIDRMQFIDGLLFDIHYKLCCCCDL